MQVMETVESVRNLFVKGGPVMWPLLACSLVSVTLTVERLIFWWRERLARNREAVEKIFRHVEKGEFDEALADPGTEHDPFSRVLRAGLAHRGHGLSEAMQVESTNEIDRMKRGLMVLDTIITMAPLLGILGTVTGIIRSFDLLGSGEVEDPRMVTGGIAEALITTAAGLVIALITLVPFNYFVARTQAAAKSIEQIATQFEVAYRRSRSKTDNETQLPG